LNEPVVLLVPPRVPEGEELCVQGGQVAADVAVEHLQGVREAAQLRGVDDGLGHETCSGPMDDGYIIAQVNLPDKDPVRFMKIGFDARPSAF
jgi:hypothetical protein